MVAVIVQKEKTLASASFTAPTKYFLPSEVTLLVCFFKSELGSHAENSFKPPHYLTVSFLSFLYVNPIKLSFIAFPYVSHSAPEEKRVENLLLSGLK